MNKQIIKIVLGVFLLLLTACKTPYTTTLVSTHYDEKSNQTSLTLLPYGTIVMPDQWTKTSYNPSSRQFFFTNNKETTLAVTKGIKSRYSFYTANQTDQEFVKNFVQWEQTYYEEQGFTVTVLESQLEQGYMIWQIKDEEGEILSIFLYGVKKGIVYNFGSYSKQWTETEIKDFLLALFHNN